MKIAFLGDIALVGRFDRCLSDKVDDRIELLSKKLKNFDYVIANLESPFTELKSSLVCKSMHLRSSCVNVKTLKRLGVNAVSLANNHIFDFGKKGFKDTIHILESNDIEWYGVANKSLFKCIDGENISISGFCCLSTNGVMYNKKGINTLTYRDVQKQLKHDKDLNALSICSLHWGIEHTNYPSVEHISFAHKILKKNNIIIHGHHPHVIQGVERVHNGLVAYSLGNAIFDETESINKKLKVDLEEDNRKSFILVVEIQNGKIIDYYTEGMYISNDGIIESYDISEELSEVSLGIKNGLKNKSVYNRKRMEQYNNVIKRKFGNHDLKWVLSRVNYYAIGAKIMTYLHSNRYKKEKVSFY